MDKKKSETKEKNKINKKENNLEVTDFDDLRAEQEEESVLSEDIQKTEGNAEEDTGKDLEKKSFEKENSKKEDLKEKSSEKKESDQKDSEKKESIKEVGKDLENTDEKHPEAENLTKDSRKSSNVISGSKKLADIKAAKENEAKSQNLSKKNTGSSGKENGKKGLWIALGSVAGLLLIVYVAGFVYFGSHFYNQVTINGVNVSGMNENNAKQTLDQFYKSYKLKLTLIDDSEKVIDGDDISMQIMLKDEFSDCFKGQKAYLWFINMFKNYDFSVGADTKWDEAALETVFDSMDILKKKNMEKPEDAYVGVVDGKFAIVKEKLGTTIQVDSFKKMVAEGLSSVAAEINLVDGGCYDLPGVYEDNEELKTELDEKNAYAKNEIKLQLDDLTLEPGMELYESVLEKKGSGYEVSEKKIEKYVEDLAKEYDTLGTDRTFTTSWNEKQITTHGEAFGYAINQEETINALNKALRAKKPSTVEVVFDSKGFTMQGENDIGNTYIEVNLSEQHVYAYKNGKKVAEGDCVSGKEATGNGTCIGLYAIQGKQSPAVLRGEKKAVTKTVTKKNKKGKKVKVQETSYEYEYESPVTYWMPFSGGIGLHDASGWRSQYGGSIYYYSGSHGCVNLPLDLAKTLYENFEIGDPVVVYFWDNENRK